jgi:hypothetical protein
MTTSATEYAYIRLTVEIPKRLTNKAVDEVVTMCASHLKVLLGRQYKQQTHRRVSARVSSRGSELVG